MNTDITLYGTAACHLCDEAYAILQPLVQMLALRMHQVDIAEDDMLLQTYGLYIPVLSAPAGELRWPFDAESAKAFLAQSKN